MVNKFRRNFSGQNHVPCRDWEKFYFSILPPKIVDELSFFGVFDPFLDSDITLDEIQLSINECKPNKAAGLVLIPNECFKALNSSWVEFLLGLFNQVLHSEYPPKAWSSIKIKMIFKKGDPLTPIIIGYSDFQLHN